MWEQVVFIFFIFIHFYFIYLLAYLSIYLFDLFSKSLFLATHLQKKLSSEANDLNVKCKLYNGVIVVYFKHLFSTLHTLHPYTSIVSVLL